MGKSRKARTGDLSRYDNRLCPRCGKPRRLHADGPTKCPTNQPSRPQPQASPIMPTNEPKRITLQCRMTEEDLAMIDAVARWHNVPDRTTAIKLVFAAEKRRIDRERSRSKKSENSDD